MLSVFKDTGGNQWATFAKYDDDGRVIWRANPSAVSGYDETRPDLLDNQSGNYSYLRDSAGVIETTSYYTSTTAGETTAGGILGYQYETKLQKGETGALRTANLACAAGWERNQSADLP